MRPTVPDRAVTAVPHSRTVLAEEDIDSALAVLRSGQIAESDATRELERVVAESMGLAHAWATAGGTAALYCALLCMEVGRGDEVLIPTYVCDDVLSAVIQTGATPVPVDVDPTDMNPDPADARSKLTPATRAVVLAHILGMPADVSAFQGLGPEVVEDLAHGIGAALPGGPAGSAGRCAIVSLHALKMLTAGLGGLVLTDDDGLAERYGRFLEPDFSRGEHRLHSRLSNVLAAIALPQARRLADTVAVRRELANRYEESLSGLDGARPLATRAADGRESSCYRWALVLSPDHPLEEVTNRFAERGVVVRRPVKQLCHRALGLEPDSCPQAEALFDRVVSLPLYPSLTRAEQDAVIEAALEILS